MFKRELLNKIFIEGPEEYLSFSHDDKVWVMPKRGVTGAMDMYQPATRGGDMLKNSIIKKHKKPFYARESKMETLCLKLNPELEKQIKNMVGISDFYVASYMGDTSSSHNDKAVLQLYSDGEIYAYVKVTTNEDNVIRFKKEADTLKDLRDTGVEYVPRVLGLDTDSEIKMFAQSNEKPLGQKVKLQFNEQIIELVKDLVDKTKRNVSYENSDFYEYVEDLKKLLEFFNEEQQEILEEAIGIIEAKDDITFAFSHGDFTPWNVYYVKDEIRLFDLEYSNKTMPAYIDVFHFLSQLSLLGKRYTPQCAMQQYERNLKLIGAYIDNPKFTYICYLVWIISFYNTRPCRNVERVDKKIDVWIQMLEYLIKYL